MWIRSQDQAILFKLGTLVVDDSEIFSVDYSALSDTVVRYSVGRFSSDTRALKILDDIQDFLIWGRQVYEIPTD